MLVLKVKGTRARRREPHAGAGRLEQGQEETKGACL